MNRVVVVSLALTALSACTLLLPTDQIIQPCTASDECLEGFICEENACLPIDEAAEIDSGAE